MVYFFLKIVTFFRQTSLFHTTLPFLPFIFFINIRDIRISQTKQLQDKIRYDGLVQTKVHSIKLYN